MKEACELAERLHIPSLILWHTEDKNISGRKSSIQVKEKSFTTDSFSYPTTGKSSSFEYKLDLTEVWRTRPETDHVRCGEGMAESSVPVGRLVVEGNPAGTNCCGTVCTLWSAQQC